MTRVIHDLKKDHFHSRFDLDLKTMVSGNIYLKHYMSLLKKVWMLYACMLTSVDTDEATWTCLHAKVQTNGLYNSLVTNALFYFIFTCSIHY